ncbi:unnamed protein product [Pleuronectes platessa]|uniref:Uncharacterized protein n=1 Tax=Pleuronectes platessa TaxID=8262 RepID=A0A9N7VJI8_PLEPL|nr:unnamed protein product [Pleuronectes platessa]
MRLWQLVVPSHKALDPSLVISTERLQTRLRSRRKLCKLILTEVLSVPSVSDVSSTCSSVPTGHSGHPETPQDVSTGITAHLLKHHVSQGSGASTNQQVAGSIPVC